MVLLRIPLRRESSWWESQETELQVNDYGIYLHSRYRICSHLAAFFGFPAAVREVEFVLHSTPSEDRYAARLQASGKIAVQLKSGMWCNTRITPRVINNLLDQCPRLRDVAIFYAELLV